MTDNIAAVPLSIEIAKRTGRIMLQAVIGGLSIAIVLMIFAAFGVIPAVLGAFLQEAIDVASILWALAAAFEPYRRKSKRK
jgi:cation transport ATPase